MFSAPTSGTSRGGSLTHAEAIPVLRGLGVNVSSVDDVRFVSRPVGYKKGRLRVFILTAHHLVYARALDPFQTLYNFMAGKGDWDLDWCAPVEDLAFIDDDDGTGVPSVGGGKCDHHAALLTVHLRRRDAWLGDPSSTRIRAIAVDPTQAETARDHLRAAMRSKGRTPELCWVERPTQTSMVVYLKPATDGGAAAAAMVVRICVDHGLVPSWDEGVHAGGSGGASSEAVHRCVRAVTPPGAPTAMEVRLRLGRHQLKGDMLVVEYRRMTVEDAAWKGMQVAGLIVAGAALAALATAAAAALAAAVAATAADDRAGDDRPISYHRRNRCRRGAGPVQVYYFSDPSRPFSELGNARRRSRSAPTWQPAPRTNDSPWVVQASDPSLGSGTAARDAFFDRFSTNMCAALSNAAFVGPPSSPALFALVRETPSATEAEDDLDDWTMVLTPESRWGATAADEPSAPSAPSAPPRLTGTGENAPAEGVTDPTVFSSTSETFTETAETVTVSTGEGVEAITPSRPAVHSAPHLETAPMAPAVPGRAPAAMTGSGVLHLDVDSDGVPKHFLCPITQELFEDPVIWLDGHTYSRRAIAHWLRHKNTSPMTGEHFSGSAVLLPNHAMRSQVEEWRCQHPEHQ